MSHQNVEVRGLFFYPVKSCRGIELQQAQLTAEGMPYDRQWMIVAANGRAVTQRDIALLALVETALEDASLVLSRPGHGAIRVPLEHAADAAQQPRLQVKIWKDECTAIEVSPQASDWVTQALESTRSLRLVRMAPGAERAQTSPEYLGENTRVQFADAAPYLVIDEASLERLNSVLVDKGDTAVPMNRFRPNIVVRGLPPFGEHETGSLGNERYRFNFRLPCERCVVPTINQQTAERHPAKEPFATLRDINPLDPKRRQPLFGQYATLQTGAGETIIVGETLQG